MGSAWGLSRRARGANLAFLRPGVLVMMVAFALSACATGGERVPDLPASSGQIGEPQLAEPEPERRSRRRVEPLTPYTKRDQADQLVRVALLLPLTSSNAGARAEAAAMLKAAELALFSVGHANMVLIPKDTAGTAPGARAAAEAALADGADIILGPLFSISVEATTAVVDGDKPIIAFSNDSALAGQGALLLGLTPETEIERLVEYASATGLTRVGLITPANTFGYNVQDTAQRTAERTGVLITQTEVYPEGANAVELSQPVQSLAEGIEATTFDPLTGATVGGGFDALILPEGGARLLALGPILPRFGIDPRTIRFMGTSLWRDDRLLNEPALDGGWFVAPDPTASEAFEIDYFEAFGETPRRLSSLAYDAVALTALLSRDRGAAGLTEEAFLNPQGFFGSDGLFRFSEDGLSERTLAVFQIRNASFELLDPAPAAFPPPQPPRPGGF